METERGQPTDTVPAAFLINVGAPVWQHLEPFTFSDGQPWTLAPSQPPVTNGYHPQPMPTPAATCSRTQPIYELTPPERQRWFLSVQSVSFLIQLVSWTGWMVPVR